MNNGKKVIETCEKPQGTTEWVLDYVIEQDFDDEGRELRNFSEMFRYTYTDTVLTETTYTSKGEKHTYRRFKTFHSSNDNPLSQTRLDSFVYHYDIDDNLITLEFYYHTYTILFIFPPPPIINIIAMDN